MRSLEHLPQASGEHEMGQVQRECGVQTDLQALDCGTQTDLPTEERVTQVALAAITKKVAPEVGSFFCWLHGVSANFSEYTLSVKLLLRRDRHRPGG